MQDEQFRIITRNLKIAITLASISVVGLSYIVIHRIFMGG